MPLYYSNSKEAERQRAFAALALPQAVVVIDVRQGDPQDEPLLTYLMTEIEDLSVAMRRNHVPRWRHLSECIDFLKVDATPSYTSLHEPADFVLTTRLGQQRLIQGLENLVRCIGREHLDGVRNARIRAIKDADAGIEEFAAHADSEQPTVRIIFLTDMEERDSLNRAATYAEGLKIWTEEAHGQRRFSRAECIQTVAFCLNAEASVHYDVLIPTLSKHSKTAVDAVILLQTYGDNEAFIGREAQISQAELILYTLLLHWPEIFEQTRPDPQRVHAITGAATLPCPTYTLGISALEYSARWAMRWLDYAVTAKLLAIVNDTRQVDQDTQALRANIRKWVKHWWQEVETAIPGAIATNVDGLRVFVQLPQVLISSPFSRNRPANALSALSAFRQQVSEFYTGARDATLQCALEHKASLLETVKGMCEYARNGEEEEQEEVKEAYKKLAYLYTEARQILSLHFQGAWGALPRATQQLHALTEAVHEIRSKEQQLPDLLRWREQFEHQVDSAYKELAPKLKIWNLPFVGKLLPSTALSWMLVLLLGALVLLGIGWQSFSFFGLSATQTGITLAIKVSLLALLIGSEFLFLSARNRAIQRKCQRIHDELCRTVQAHLSEAGSIIAARVALALLEWADLYVPGKDASPYEQKLRELDRILRTAQKYTSAQQTLAESRLKLVSGQQQGRTSHNETGGAINNRREILAWKRVEDAFLQAYNELTANADPLNLLAEMLLRRLGTESPPELLEDMLNKRRWTSQAGKEARAQAATTLLVAMTLTSESVPPNITDVFPLLKLYATLDEGDQQETLLTGNNLPNLEQVMRGALLEQARERNTPTQIWRETFPALTLVGWVARQRANDPQLMQVLASGDVLNHLAEDKIDPPQALDMLEKYNTLLGYPDEMTGDDHFYLFLASGEEDEAFTGFSDGLQHAQIQLVPFPDAEKLVYCHIHRIRGVLPRNALSTRKST